MFKRTDEWGVLSRPAKVSGWALIILAALCLLAAGILGFRHVSRFEQQLENQSMTAQDVKSTVGEVNRWLMTCQFLMFSSASLVILSMGCAFFGRRKPPPSKSKETPETATR